MPAWKRGFCRSKAASNVDPERGKPDMKWTVGERFNQDLQKLLS